MEMNKNLKENIITLILKARNIFVPLQSIVLVYRLTAQRMYDLLDLNKFIFSRRYCPLS